MNQEEDVDKGVNTYSRIEDLLGLHQDLTLIYVVDGYDATLSNEDAYPSFEYTGHGKTIAEALTYLNQILVNEIPSNWSATDLKNNGFPKLESGRGKAK